MTPDQPHPDHLPIQDRKFAWLSLAAFVACVVLVSWRHEPWRDETQTWRLAIDSDGIAALAHNARFEGTPLLFHVLLQLVGHLSRSWWMAVALHLSIATGVAWLILRWSPFTRLQKLLLIAGYFPAYEYAVVVRPYGLGLLLGLAACMALTAKPSRPILASILLALMANTSVVGLVLALALGLAYGVDWTMSGREPGRIPAQTAAIAAACLVVGSSLALMSTAGEMARTIHFVAAKTVTQITTPDVVAPHWTMWRVGGALSIPLKALTPFAPIRDGGVIWNTWAFLPEERRWLALQTLASAGVCLIGLAIVIRRRIAALFLLIATSGVVAFAVIRGLQIRHIGAFFVAWIIAAWLARLGPEQAWPGILGRVAQKLNRPRPWWFTVSLIPMVLAGIEVATGDALEPFSDARNVAKVLSAPSLAGVPLLTTSRSRAQTVAALSGRPVFMTEESRWGTFVVWGRNPIETPQALTAAVDSAVAATLQRECRALVLSIPVQPPSDSLRTTSRLLYTTVGPVMSQERYQLWLVAPPPSARCPASDQ